MLFLLNFSECVKVRIGKVDSSLSRSQLVYILPVQVNMMGKRVGADAMGGMAE